MLEDPEVAIVGGRQQAYPHASSAEKLVRAHNYPCISRVWGSEQIKELGVRAYLISDVFAAYRRDAYEQVGGFDRPILTNEDMLITQKFLKAGYKAAYAGDAVVYHSHNFTLRQQYRRNYIIGRTMVRYEDRFENGQELGEGVSLAKNVMVKLLKNGDIVGCFYFAFDCVARLVGNRKGRADERRA
jgi:rhamnosyltransferase